MEVRSGESTYKYLYSPRQERSSSASNLATCLVNGLAIVLGNVQLPLPIPNCLFPPL